MAVPLGNETVARSVSSSLSSRPGRIIVYFLVFFWTIPTFGLLVSSVRPEKAVKTSGWWNIFAHPQFTLDNYKTVLDPNFSSGSLWQPFLNSFKITIPAVVISVGIAAVMAYALSWMEFPGRDWLFVGTVALLVVPLQMSLIPLLRLFTGGAHLGSVTIFPNLSEGAHIGNVMVFPSLQNSVITVWIAHTCFGLPFVVFILRNFMASLPRELIEAARVDGATHLTIFLKLVLPLAVPAIASVGIFQFVNIWNDYFIGKIFAGGDNSPIIARFVDLAGTRGGAWHLLTAAAFVSMIVPLVVFFSLQKYFVRGLLSGAVKG
jgi:alpha-glucoside transport system permease protein